MKNLTFLLLILFFLRANLSAQQKFFIGGSASFTNEKLNNEFQEVTNLEYELNPSIGFHLKKNWIVGITSSLSFDENDNIYDFGDMNFSPSNFNFTQKIYGLGVFIRKRYPLIENFALYTQANAAFSEVRVSLINGPDIIDKDLAAKEKTANLQIGIEYRFGKRWMLNTNIAGVSYFKRITFSTLIDNAETFNIYLRPRFWGFNLNYYLW